MGSVAVKACAGKGDRVIMACRNLQKAESVRADIMRSLPSADIEIASLDLSSMKSVRAFADSLSSVRIDALFNNAGIINRHFQTTEDGFENTIATNYLGPFLLTSLLLPRMAPHASVVNMVSLTCRFGRVDSALLPGKHRFSQLGTYSDTKLALLLFSIALSRRNPGLRVNVSDPGVVNSNMISMGRWFDGLADVLFRPFCKSPESGAAPALRALESVQNLEYFVGNTHKPIADRYLNHPYLDALWNETCELLFVSDYF